MGLRSLQRVQLGREAAATPGTAVAATAKLTGVYSAVFHEERVHEQPQELRGSLARHFRTVLQGKMATLDLETTATFEDTPHLLGMAIKSGQWDGTSDGATADPSYIRTYTPALTATDDPDTYTIEVGSIADDTGAGGTACVEMEYSFVRSLEISAAAREMTRVRANIVGRQLTKTTWTGGTADDERTTEDALGQQWKVYIDDASTGTIGTTLYGGCVVGFTWRLPENFREHMCLDGNLYFNRHEQSSLAPELELTVEVDGAAEAIRQDWANGGTARQLIRLEVLGGTVHSGTPTATARKSLRIDGAYSIIDWGAIGGSDQDGVNTVRILARGEYDATYGKLFECRVVNALAALR
jgi:hypothetical protein